MRRWRTLQVGRDRSGPLVFPEPTATPASRSAPLVSSGRPQAPIPLASPSALSVRRRMFPADGVEIDFYFVSFENFCPGVVPKLFLENCRFKYEIFKCRECLITVVWTFLWPFLVRRKLLFFSRTPRSTLLTNQRRTRFPLQRRTRFPLPSLSTMVTYSLLA